MGLLKPVLARNEKLSACVRLNELQKHLINSLLKDIEHEKEMGKILTTRNQGL
jgi:hypothetical protein